MAEWTIYGSSGVAKATVKELELHDEWMAECFITVSVKSAEPIDFAVGDYIDYRNERYSINYDPSKIKKARRGTYGEGFVYDNIKFVAVQDELVRCDFCDIVLSDNQVHYTQLPTFPFYCETVDDLLDRLQANMEDLYPGSWIIVSPDLARDRQRGLCVGREQAFVNAYNQYIGEGSEFEYEKTGVALTVDNINCWEALAKVNSDFDLNFIIRDRIVIVGSAGVFVHKKFKYGKGNGLYELEVIGDSEQKVVTRLKAYGSENNLPERYYATKGGRPFFKVSEANPGSSTEHAISVLIDNSRYSSVFTDVVDEVSSSQKICIGSCEIDGIEFDAAFELVGNPTCTTRLLVGANGYPLINGLDLPTVPQSVVDSLKAVIEVGTDVIFNDGVDISYVDDNHVKYASGLPENMAINKLMLPGFPEMSLDAWVRANRPELIAEGFEFSTNALRPYIDSPNKNIYGIRPDNIFFDGSNETEEIYPTIEGMEWEGNPCDVVVSADQITDNGVLADDAKEVEKRVSITIPYAGFDLNKEWTDGATISMKNGMCGARDFKILKKPTRDDDGNWVCVCERAYDSTLHLYFPYSDFQINAGDKRDKFVLTGIDLPDSYIEAASEKLFDAAMDALRKNHLPRVTFQPRIDHLFMARQHDTAMESGGTIESLHDTLKAGDYFSFVDEDFGVDTSVIIDILTIKEHADNGLPTYEVTLRDEKAVSTLQKRLEKIASSNGTGSNGGSYSMRQTGSLVEQIGNDLYLSKIEDDQAQGWIGFLKGAWFGAKQWIIDNTGSANLFNATINGVLKAYNAVINTVKSTNYSGEGMLDTGWLITNAYGSNNSKAVFDYLYIRKKALFEELEIRKITHIGGDFALSPASGRAYRVEYYDANGNKLGMEEVTVPWMLGYKIMLLFSNSKANKYFGRRKMVERSLKPEERQLVRRVRVYLFSDDGTTQTMSNWTVGAQARCQSFNIEKQMEYHGSGEDSDNPDVTYWTGKKVENTYWWRLVNAVGEGTLKDGKTHSYIEFLCNTGNDYDVADTGSDLPAVGDEFAQFGHRTRPELSNVIMLETARGDSPAIKLYTGINSWDLKGKRVSCISPEMTEFTSNRFRLTTDYNGDVQLNDRGLWIDIPTERILVTLPNIWGNVRKCYYNDIVSHNGKWWQCVIASGTHKEDENGHWYTQEELDWLIAHDMEKYNSLVDAENYTTLEPGDATLQQKSAWMEKTDYRVQTARVEFSNPMFVGTGQHSSTVTLKVSNLSAAIDRVTVEDSENEVTWNGSQLVCNASVNHNRKVVVTVHGILNNITYEASDVVCVYRLASSYTSSATPSQFAFRQNESYPYQMNIDGVEEIEGTVGNSCTQLSVVGDSSEQPFRITRVTCVGYSDDEEQHREPGISCTYNNVTGRAWFVLVSNRMVKGKMTVTIAYGNNVTENIEVPFVSSLNGTWITEIENDVKTEVATKMEFDICDETGQVIKTTTLAEYTRSSSEDSAKLTKTTETQGQQITATNNRVDTAESSIRTLNSQMDGTTDSGLKTSITNTNTRIDTAEQSIQTIEKESLTVIDIEKWESGKTTGETAGKTYDEIKDDSTTTIRTKTLIPVTATTAISMTNTNYKVGFVCFDSDNETIVYSGSSAWSGWTTGSNDVIILNPPSGVCYIAILLCKVSGAAISPSEVASTELYLSDKAYSTRKQTATDISDMVVTPLGETGIHIDGINNRIDLIGGKVRVLKNDGQTEGEVEFTSDGRIKAEDGEFSGRLSAQYMYSKTQSIEVPDGEEMHFDILGTEHKYNTFYISTPGGSTTAQLFLPSAESFEGIELCFFHPVFTSSTGVAFLVYNMPGSKLYEKSNGLYVEVTSGYGYAIPKNTLLRVRAINHNWFIIDNI